MPNLNFHSVFKIWTNVPQVSYKGGLSSFQYVELDNMWIGWANQVTHFDLPMLFTALSFQNENFYINIELTKDVCCTRMKLILVS